MSTLTEALTSAKKEIESQSVRLRDLEAMLTEERRAREDAEERANRLERESSKELQERDLQHTNGDIHTNGPSPDDASDRTIALEGSPTSTDPSDATSRLQQRLDLMMTEMSEMKQQMERYRERAETAEADRQSLAEMIENIRRDNARASSRDARRRSRSNSRQTREVVSSGIDGADHDLDAEEGEITIIKDKDLDDDGTEEMLSRANLSNGHAVEYDEKASLKPANVLVQQHGRSDLMYHGGPVGAMVAVVAIGVAVMAMLNQYPKVER